jgi:hypothetical protein
LLLILRYQYFGFYKLDYRRGGQGPPQAVELLLLIIIIIIEKMVKNEKRYERSDYRLIEVLTQNISVSGLLRDVRWFETDVLRLPISLIFKSQALTLEDKTAR